MWRATSMQSGSKLSGALHRSVALAAPTPAGIDDPSNVAPGRTPKMARQCSQIRDQRLHRRVLYLFSVSHASDISHLRYRYWSFWLTLPMSLASFINVDV